MKSTLSFIDFKCISTLIGLNSDKKTTNVKRVHGNKLLKLGIDISKKIDCNKVIFNFSNRILTDEEKELLSLGLDFCLPPPKVKFFDHFLSFEKICNTVKNCNKYGNESWNSLLSRISVIANDSFKTCNREMKKLSCFNSHQVRILENLKKDTNLIITRPDKGRGVVLLNKTDYDDKIFTILNDISKFKKLSIDTSTHILKLEDKLNRILRNIKSNIGDTIYNNIYASGSRPGKLYGLPKVHKDNNPLRPIISSIGTFNYNLAKFLVPLIAPVTKNEYTVENSTDFVNQITSLQFSEPVVMASIDVESLFTNVPLKETTEIITNNLMEINTSLYGLTRNILLKLLNIVTSDSVFTFNGDLYAQVDGVAMGSPVGPSYANAFLCHFEKIWLDNCPTQFKPLYYRRYIDDTFLIFKDTSHVNSFVEYMNLQHANIKFTSEIENESKLAFLDTLVTNVNGHFSTSIYRKPTFTGLGLNFRSFTPKLFKLNSIKTLINRAYNICSSYSTFDLEMKYLHGYFLENSYLSSTFYKILRNFLDNKFTPKPKIPTVKRDIRYLKLPFYGNESFKIRNSFNDILRESFPQIKFNFIFTNKYTIGSLLKTPQPLPFDLRSSVVYLYSCSRCNSRYVGSTTRWMKHRVLDHCGRSFRTNLPLTKPSFSAIRDHSHDNQHPITHDSFTILASAPFRSDLLILESLYINSMKPDLNNTTTAVQLYTK